MTRYKNRLARLEGSKNPGLIIIVVDCFWEDGPVIETAWDNEVHYRRHDDETEEDFRFRVEQCARPHLHARANGNPH